MKGLFIFLTFILLSVQLFVATAKRSNLITELAKGNKQALAKYQGELKAYRKLASEVK